MAGMDLDEPLGGPSKAPTRTTRFAPKGAKAKPIPKVEPDIKPEYATGANEMDIEMKPVEKSENVVKDEEADDLMQTEALEAETEPEDEVVREIDVYFTPSGDPSIRLYVLQYPLRPVWRPLELDEKCQEVRVKPTSAEVEVDLAVDIDSKNYDSSVDSRLQMMKQTLTTTWKTPHSSRYAVGVLTENKLHLNPIHAVVQLRTSMKHLDSKESKSKSSVPSNVKNVKSIVKTEDPQEGKPSGASKKLNKIPEQNKDSEETWVPLRYHGTSSDTSAGYLQNMLAREGSQINFPMSSYDYLNSLCPGTSDDSFSSKGPTRRSLLALPLKERFKKWLLEGPPVHRFDALKHLAPDESTEEVLGILQEHGRLVQGLWVPKSSLVYGTEGIDVLARDYVLLLFSKHVIIKNSQLPQMPSLSKAMKNVLNILAAERNAFNDWKLRELPDMSFVKLYPSIVQKQEEEWECIDTKIQDFLYKMTSKSNTTKNLPKSRSANKTGVKTPSEATTTNGMPEEVRKAVTKALENLFKSVKICRIEQISQRLKDMAVSESAAPPKGVAKEAQTAANSIDTFPIEVQAIISQVAYNVHGLCVPKSSPDHPEFDQFRKVVLDLFVAGPPNATLKKATMFEAAKMELKRDITTTEYTKVMKELCSSKSSGWALQSGDGNPKH